MSDPYVGEIKLFGFHFPPRGWALCNGQLLPINQNQALFTILGTTYGGDGRTTFALPDLRGRTPLHMGNGVTLGQSAGEENHTLTQLEMPAHIHQVQGSPAEATEAAPTGAVWGLTNRNPFKNAASDTTLNLGSMSTAGSSQAHPNMQPYLTLNFCIATTGIFPTRD
jgi:microcystin-dependent protein